MTIFRPFKVVSVAAEKYVSNQFNSENYYILGIECHCVKSFICLFISYICVLEYERMKYLKM